MSQSVWGIFFCFRFCFFQNGFIPGIYKINKKTFSRKTSSRKSKIMQIYDAGEEIYIKKIINVKEEFRIRGQISKTEYWISIFATDNSKQFLTFISAVTSYIFFPMNLLRQ